VQNLMSGWSALFNPLVLWQAWRQEPLLAPVPSDMAAIVEMPSEMKQAA
jgi:hypothetical protein